MTILDAINQGNLELAQKLIAEGSEESQEEEKKVSTKVETSSQDKQEKQTSSQSKQKQQTASKKEKPKSESKTKKQPPMEEYIKPVEYDLVKSYVQEDEPVMLFGEAGTGKNELCSNIAKELGLNFYFANAVNDIFQLTGYGNASGDYVKTQFYDFCINGGLFLFDEIDASSSEALIVFNSAIANRYFDFPVIGRVKLNENCRFIACANTKGVGASLRYCGRNQLDAATLDRFAIIELHYDKKVERKIAQGDEELVEFIEDFRNACNRTGVDIVVSYRAIKRIAKLKERMDTIDLLKSSLIKQLEKTDCQSIYDNMKVKATSYYIAFAKICGF